MEDTQKALAERVRQLRKRAKLTQEALAEKAELSIQHISDLERGRGNPTLQSLNRLSTALGVNLWDLVNSEGHALSDAELEKGILDVFRSLNRKNKLVMFQAIKCLFV